MSDQTKANGQFLVTNPLGLHVRSAAAILKTLTPFRSRVTLVAGGVEADARSMLQLLELSASQGTLLAAEAEGPDAEAALAALGALVGRNFDE